MLVVDWFKENGDVWFGFKVKVCVDIVIVYVGILGVDVFRFDIFEWLGLDDVVVDFVKIIDVLC